MRSNEITKDLSPRLVIEGVDNAIAYYVETLEAEVIDRFTGPGGIVVHATLRIGQCILSMAEQVPKWQLFSPAALGGSPVLMRLTISDPDAVATRMVGRGGEIILPIEDRSYRKREGRVRDPFGHLWILSRPTETISHDEIQQRLGP
jgi:PhnB protein